MDARSDFCCVPGGGPGDGYEWIGREHVIEVDERGFVWIGGNADNALWRTVAM